MLEILKIGTLKHKVWTVITYTKCFWQNINGLKFLLTSL